MLIINNLEEYKKLEGKELGTSKWYKINQDQIDSFANATLDHQWIHTEPEKAKNKSTFKKTIAHGYLTLSLVPYLWNDIVDVRNLNMLVNYGIENFRFNQPVLVDSEVRLKGKLKFITDLKGIAKATIEVTLEIRNNKKPAFKGDIIFLYHFN